LQAGLILTLFLGCGWKRTASKGWRWTPLGGEKERRGLEVSSARRGEREEGK